MQNKSLKILKLSKKRIIFATTNIGFMDPFLIDVPVLILFFNRPYALAQVFEQVRNARPSKLFLYQDGPRNENDYDNMDACRKIVENIDWECEVHKSYQKENSGCDPSNYYAQKWAFSIVDKCIVFEDDSVPSVSFFSFCKELLDLYEKDERIGMISGLNHEGITEDINSDYFFSTSFSIWGWASWRRVIDKWDDKYNFLDDSSCVKQMHSLFKQRKYRDEFFNIAKQHKESGKSFYETIFYSELVLNSQLSIIPKKNMIHNLGPDGGDSTHYGNSIKTLPKSQRRIFTMPTYEVETPLKHTEYIIENIEYRKRLYKIMGWGHPFIKISRSFEELYLNIRYCNFETIFTSIKKRLMKWFGKYQYK